MLHEAGRCLVSGHWGTRGSEVTEQRYSYTAFLWQQDKPHTTRTTSDRKHLSTYTDIDLRKWDERLSPTEEQHRNRWKPVGSADVPAAQHLAHRFHPSAHVPRSFTRLTLRTQEPRVSGQILSSSTDTMRWVLVEETCKNVSKSAPCVVWVFILAQKLEAFSVNSVCCEPLGKSHAWWLTFIKNKTIFFQLKGLSEASLTDSKYFKVYLQNNSLKHWLFWTNVLIVDCDSGISPSGRCEKKMMCGTEIKELLW